MEINTEINTESNMKMTEELRRELENIRIAKGFNPEKFAETRTDEFLNYLKKYNINSVVISVSGGIDSSCVLGLLSMAQTKANNIPSHPFNKINGGKIIPLAQPIFSTESIQNRAWELENQFGVKIKTICQDSLHEKLNQIIAEQFGEPLNNFSSSMLKSYMRTPPAYAIAQNYNGIVIGTGNLDEDGYLYYYCKFGDGAVDVGLIWDLHKSEVFSLGKYLQVPQSILDAQPSADLYPGQTDSTEIGMEYDFIELIYNYINIFTPEQQTEFINRLSDKSLDQFNRAKNIAEQIHNRGLHKADLNPKNIGNILI